MLGVVRTRPGQRVRVCKRDIRHFYHRLKCGAKWRPYLAHPRPLGGTPVQRRIFKKRLPVHCAWPMGFAGSASFAQGVADVCVARAALPAGRRIRQGDMPPKRLPCYG
eukprot:123532-Lingulodinium_polyedra.AAC.1